MKKSKNKTNKNNKTIKKYSKAITPRSIEKSSSKPLFFENPIHYPKNTLMGMNTWTPNEYYEAIKHFNLDGTKKKEMLTNFKKDLEDTVEFLKTNIMMKNEEKVFTQLNKDLVSIGLKEKDIDQHGGSKYTLFTETPGYTNYKKIWTMKHISMIGGGNKNKIMNDFRFDKNVFREIKNHKGGAQIIPGSLDGDEFLDERVSEQCQVYKINGKELEGPELMLCMEAYSMDPNNPEREKKLEQLEKIKNCLEDPVIMNKISELPPEEDDRGFGEDMAADNPSTKRGQLVSNCIEKKNQSFKVESMIANMFTLAYKGGIDENQADTLQHQFNEHEHKDTGLTEIYGKMVETETKPGMTPWSVFSSALSLGKTTIGYVASPLIAVSTWIIKDPKTTRIAFYLAKKCIQKWCKSIHTEYMGMHYKDQTWMESTAETFGVDADGAKIAAQAGVRGWIHNGGVETLFKGAASITKGAVQGLAKNTPIVSSVYGVVEGAGSALYDMGLEATKEAAEMALYQKDLQESGKLLMDILVLIIPNNRSGCFNPAGLGLLKPKTGGGSKKIKYNGALHSFNQQMDHYSKLQKGGAVRLELNSNYQDFFDY